jgi:hypothetical protein
MQDIFSSEPLRPMLVASWRVRIISGTAIRAVFLQFFSSDKCMFSTTSQS